MKSIVKFLAPATLALAAMSANAAGLIETDYPADRDRAAAISVESTGAAIGVGSGLNLLHSESAPRDLQIPGFTAPTRDEVLRDAQQPRETDTGYFA